MTTESSTRTISPAAPRTAPGDFPPATLPQGQVRLEHLGVIRVQGQDAATFLQGQLSNDVLLLKPGQARLAAYCSAKGRVLASFMVLKTIGQEGAEPEFLLIIQRDVLEATLKRLRMFVLRAKAVLSEASADYVLTGLLGGVAVPDDLPAAPWSAIGMDPHTVLIRLHTVLELPRALMVRPVQAVESSAAAQPLPLADWLWLETLSGVPLIHAALADQLVPQMLNYESTGGVSFKKGCYPGQEVVARSQFRGTLKRRLYLVRTSVPLQPGQDVLSHPSVEDVTGLVVQAAALPGMVPAQWVASVSVQIAAAESDSGLYIQSSEGLMVPLTLLDRPYPLLENI